jgi:hypothetical protein
MQIDIRDVVAAIKPGALQEYLRSRGWALERSDDGVASYRKGAAAVDVPLRTVFVDYVRRVSEVLETLRAVEDVSALGLLDDLTQPVGDVVAIGIVSERTAQGTLPLVDSLRVHEATKNMILAATHSVLAPQPYFPRMSRTDAVELLATVHEGQTHRGSFVSRFIIPVVPEVGKLEVEEPLGRRVVAMLMGALEAVRLVRSLGTYDELLSMEKQGVSGNLLAALAQLRPVGALDVRVSWARNRPRPPSGISRVELSTDALQGLEAVAESMRARVQNKGFEMMGHVTRLDRVEPTGPGDIIVVPRSEQSVDIPRVYVHLEGDEYAEAIKAHEAGDLVRVVGTLTKQGRRWTLTDASGFEAVPLGPDNQS